MAVAARLAARRAKLERELALLAAEEQEAAAVAAARTVEQDVANTPLRRSVTFSPSHVEAEEPAMSRNSSAMISEDTNSLSWGLPAQVPVRPPSSSLNLLTAMLGSRQEEFSQTVDGVLNQVAVVEQFEDLAESVVLTDSYEMRARNLTDTQRNSRRPRSLPDRNKPQQSSSWWDQVTQCITCFRQETHALSERERVQLEYQAMLRRGTVVLGQASDAPTAFQGSTESLLDIVRYRMAGSTSGDAGGAGSSGTWLAGAPATFVQQ